ncbi:MAG: DUF2934 domain-containing protein [Sedimentisphaerales bacterium]|jgi:hypothetical protein
MAKRQTNNPNTGTARKTAVTRKEQSSVSRRSAAKSTHAIKDTPAATNRSRGGSAESVATLRPRHEQETSTLTHDQIAERAKALWQQRGCPPNEDQKNWFDAENELKMELGVR